MRLFISYTTTILLLLSYSCSRAQNYQCLQTGVKHYFTNANGYLRGIRIDSTVQNGDTTVYYPFHTYRGTCNTADPNGSSWVGGKILQLNDGTFIFDSKWGDSVVIKTQANTGDNWIFYTDSSNVYYRANVWAIDTMTILGSLDTVKRIVITAFDTAGALHSDPQDSFQIVLSKNNGFVQVFDLYTFPYHLPGAVYTSGNDFYLDNAHSPMINQFYSYSYPSPNPSIFNITNLINPTQQQLYSWHPGDIFEYRICSSYMGYNYPCQGPYHYAIDTFAWDDVSNSVMSLSYMPEETGLGQLYYYYPFDSSFCMKSPAFYIYGVYYTGNVLCPISPQSPVFNADGYKMGLGHTDHVFFNGAGQNGYIINSRDLNYYNTVGGNCGEYLSSSNIATATKLQVYPNPSNGEIKIIVPDNTSGSISIINVVGICVYKQEVSKGMNNTDVNTSNWAKGIYVVKYQGEDGTVQTERLVCE